MTADAAIGLFDRLPPNIFAILHGANARRAWELLERLAIQYFGPDSELPYADGYLHSDITKEIERFLMDKEWEIDDSEGVGQTINIKANYLLTRLVESGWLCEDKFGGRVFITMKPVVSRFFELLHQFAAEGPPMIGGNIQVVHAQMKSVVENPREQAAGFVTAAKLCTQLISSLNSTAFRVRDLMQEIVKEKEIHLFVGRFFAEHISQIYIRDFKELRTENHPLRHRMDILALVDEVARNEPSRSLLLQGYRDLPGTKPGEEEEMLERDIERFHRLMTIEGFLDRMDRTIETVYQRANAYLAYRLLQVAEARRLRLDGLPYLVDLTFELVQDRGVVFTLQLPPNRFRGAFGAQVRSERFVALVDQFQLDDLLLHVRDLHLQIAQRLHVEQRPLLFDGLGFDQVAAQEVAHRAHLL